MKIKMNLDLDIEISDGGKKLQISELWQNAQDIAAKAAKTVAHEPFDSSPKESPTEPHSDNTENASHASESSTSETKRSKSNYRSDSPPVSPSLHPLGTFLFDLLDRVAETSQSVPEKTFDDLKRSGPR